MNLYKHQQRVVDSGRNKLLLAHDVGTGKTLTLLALAAQAGVLVLIITPKGLRDQWVSKISEYGLDGVKVPTFHVITKEEFRRDHAVVPRFGAVIIDEVHHFSGYKSQMHKALLKYIARVKPRYVWSGTATPYRSEPFNIYALGRIHGLTLNWMDFRNEFYRPRYLGPRVIWEPREDEEARARLRRLMDMFCDYAPLEECFDMPEQIYCDPEVIPQSAEQKKAIKDLRLVETNPLVFAMKCQQIESGFMYGNEFVATQRIESGKKTRILELVEENVKLLVFCRFTEQIRDLERDLSAKGYNVLTITGENSAEHFAVSQKAESMGAMVLIAQMAVSAGWECPSFPVVVYASMSYSLLDAVQSRGRVIRGNKLSRHVFKYLVGGAVDKAVLDCLQAKKDFDPTTFVV